MWLQGIGFGWGSTGGGVAWGPKQSTPEAGTVRGAEDCGPGSWPGGGAPGKAGAGRARRRRGQGRRGRRGAARGEPARQLGLPRPGPPTRGSGAEARADSGPSADRRPREHRGRTGRALAAKGSGPAAARREARCEPPPGNRRGGVGGRVASVSAGVRLLRNVRSRLWVCSRRQENEPPPAARLGQRTSLPHAGRLPGLANTHYCGPPALLALRRPPAAEGNAVLQAAVTVCMSCNPSRESPEVRATRAGSEAQILGDPPLRARGARRRSPAWRREKEGEPLPCIVDTAGPGAWMR
ncbi:Dynein Heavy Chain 2, Axonemal [Manis pentadactyla]|nr:Dynein Heavy Chain 2, Axonemal [Manis pentadactyla]